ncbi:M24 family metallopeptidase [Calycomorphotria hydatis]|uniref:Putative peptidase n=1 Tax=Calycomorphotria hydatis TaxID=2528027 RepID=A0A517TE15_9PLAN|nr:Xaa-Pro peptidase family protein [Calycomorphotria hydatis]QDT66602.1 putative peptidase [Calycomorphotria hydatis]
MPADRFATRCEKLRSRLKKEEADTFLVCSETNVRYLTGFTGDSSYLLIGPDQRLLLSDSRFETQIAEECPGLDAEIRHSSQSMVKLLSKIVKSSGITKLGFESNHVSVAQWESFRDEFSPTEMIPISGLVEKLRVIKDAHEVKRIREAVRLAERSYRQLIPSLVEGMTEMEASAQLEYSARKFGALGYSFEAIIAMGDRAALPHYRPGPLPLTPDGLLLIDWGVVEPEGYCSDLTRCVRTGKLSTKLQRIYEVVAEAQRKAIAEIRPGIELKEVDAVARNVIEAAGFGKRFGHGLGHGIGLAVHEAPRLSAQVEGTLRPGMVVTVEPGIYLPGQGGVRIEDDVLVTKDGHEVLSTLPRELEHISLA